MRLRVNLSNKIEFSEKFHWERENGRLTLPYDEHCLVHIGPSSETRNFTPTFIGVERVLNEDGMWVWAHVFQLREKPYPIYFAVLNARDGAPYIFVPGVGFVVLMEVEKEDYSRERENLHGALGVEMEFNTESISVVFNSLVDYRSVKYDSSIGGGEFTLLLTPSCIVDLVRFEAVVGKFRTIASTHVHYSHPLHVDVDDIDSGVEENIKHTICDKVCKYLPSYAGRNFNGYASDSVYDGRYFFINPTETTLEFRLAKSRNTAHLLLNAALTMILSEIFVSLLNDEDDVATLEELSDALKSGNVERIFETAVVIENYYFRHGYDGWFNFEDLLSTAKRAYKKFLGVDFDKKLKEVL